MSLGFLSNELRFKHSEKKSNATDVEMNTVSIELEKNRKQIDSKDILMFIFVCLSLSGLGLILFIGLNYIPYSVLFNFSDYDSSLDVLIAMGKRLLNEPLITLSAWLVPIPFAVFIPLSITEYPLKVSSIVLSFIAWVSIFFYEERVNFIDTLKTIPEMGYMWYEAVVIALSVFFVVPKSFWLIWGGPMVAACASPYRTDRNPLLFIIIAFTSIIFVLPTVSIFVNSSGEFFLLGYSSDSVVARILSIGMIHVWVRTYHLVCRDCYNTFQKTNGKIPRVCAILYVLFNTALVEIWVCSAYALHFAYTSIFKVEEAEDKFSRWLKKNTKTFLAYLKRLSHCA